jgi:hypothetical protein
MKSLSVAAHSQRPTAINMEKEAGITIVNKQTLSEKRRYSVIFSQVE